MFQAIDEPCRPVRGARDTCADRWRAARADSGKCVVTSDVVSALGVERHRHLGRAETRREMLGVTEEATRATRAASARSRPCSRAR